jgi:hypothetical protein
MSMPVDRTGWSHRPLDTGTGNPAGEQAGSGPRRDTVANLAMNAADGDFDPFAAYLSQLGTGSRRTMREALTKLADWASDGRCGPHELQWHLLRIEETAALRTRLTSSLAPATANKHLAALRGVLKQCWRHGRMSAEAYQRAIDLSPARGASPPPCRAAGPNRSAGFPPSTTLPRTAPTGCAGTSASDRPRG